MKTLLALFALVAMTFVSCDNPSPAPTATDNGSGVAKALPFSDTFEFSLYSDCCGGEVLTFPVTYRQVTRENGGITYNWKANEKVVGGSGDSYKVVFSDNGNVRFDPETGGLEGWVGTLHARMTREDGCTVLWTIKLRIAYDANGNLVKEVMESSYTCE